MNISRRKWIQTAGLAGIGLMAYPNSVIGNQDQSIRKRAIPSSGEKIPVVGLGTWIQFDVGQSEKERAPLKQVLKKMGEQGGEVIDSSPMYGRSEQVIGELTTELGIADQFFYATKVWTRGKQDGIDQMNASMRKMNRDRIDLMQVHNLVDWQTHLETINNWKRTGKICYSGITHYTASAHDRLEEIVKNRDVDFVQFNYNIRARHAEESLLPAAADNGVAVIINRPYDGGALFGAVGDGELPEWAADFDIGSWGQFFLKYILSHPAVTCVIPGTSDPEHLVDNMQAGQGRLPDESARKRMARYFDER